MQARWIPSAVLVGLLVGLAFVMTLSSGCRAQSPGPSSNVVFGWDAELHQDECWGLTFYGDPTYVAICSHLQIPDVVHAIKHEMLHVAGLAEHLFNYAPCYNQLGSTEASLHGPCAEEVEWLRRHGLRGLRLQASGADLTDCVREAASFWNEVTGIPVFASLNGEPL